MRESIYVGFDAREAAAFAVCVHSIKTRLSRHIPIHGLVLESLQLAGLYRRPTKLFFNSDGHQKLIDEISARDDYNGAMSTEFAISRFLVPHLAGSGWALFMDCDMLVRADIAKLFALRDERRAVMCVKHEHLSGHETKMDGQQQSNYSRKNWSSVMLFNCDHPANKMLTLDMVNTMPGRDLHRFCWLEDHQIGALPPQWNWLAGEQVHIPNPQIVHHTLGSPCLRGYESAPYAKEWRDELALWGDRP